MQRSSIVFFVAYFAAALYPIVAILPVAACLVLQFGFLIVRFTANRVRPSARSSPVNSGAAPFFSVHVATHNEPPALVIATLGALSRQSYPTARFEIVVIDNNTSDPSLWEPVEAYARDNSGIRFLHRENVKGAKAGALNIALAKTDPRATHIVVIDADYIVVPDFLEVAAAMLATKPQDYLQFPQAYRGSGGAGAGLAREFGEYFKTYACRANGAEAMLLTGTLSVIAKPALEAVGGWRSDTVTEDAELGVRLCRFGFRGLYVDRIVGTGLLPLSFSSLQKQRHRWASGNMRTLKLHQWTRSRLWRSVDWRRRLMVLAQLLAWPNLGLIPVAALLGALYQPVLLGPDPADGREVLVQLSTLAILLVFAATIGNVAAAALRERWTLAEAAQAIAARLALLPVSARAAIDGLMRAPQRFIVTPKSSGSPTDFATVDIADHVILFMMSVPAVFILAEQGRSLTQLASILAMLAVAGLLPLAISTAREIARYRRRLEHGFAETG